MNNVIKLIKEKKFAESRNELINMNTADIAELIEEIDDDAIFRVFRILPKEIAAETFANLSTDKQKELVQHISDDEIREILDELFLDDAVDFLEEMPANFVRNILISTTPERRNLINQFLKYPDYSAGTIMTIEYVDLKKNMTVNQAIAHIRKTGVDKETIDTCYVVGNNRKLEGVVSIRKLILSDWEDSIENIMEEDVISISTHDDQEKITMIFKKYDFLSMPVVDNENRLVGIITIDDVVDIIDEENTEDFEKMAAMSPSDEAYLKTDVVTLARKRIMWLLILMISATFTGRIINKFSDVLQTYVILTGFIPMLMDTGGNAGSQSSTLVIRGLALGEIENRDYLKVFFKELRVSILVGFMLASVNFLRILIIEKTTIPIAATVCISLFVTVVLAKVVGGMLPIFAKRLKLDPAIMASPLITTIVDALALSTYFGLAKILIGI